MIYQRIEFFSPDECRSILDGAADLRPGAVEDASVVRRSSRAGAFKLQAALQERLFSTLKSVNERFYAFEIDGWEPLQLAEYKPGDEYDWHTDLGPKEASKRKLSASVQLSAHEDYGGGDLQFWGMREPVARAQGALIIFPAYMLHRVTLVTEGARYSLVAWSTAKRSFR